MAENPDNTLHLLQITDTHLSADPGQAWNGINTDRSLQWVIRHILRNRRNADYVLATGDLAHDGSAETYTRLHRHLAALNVPVICLAGNHDDVAILQATLPGANISCSRRISRQDWQIILLNSVVSGYDGGHLMETELDFLRQQLRSQPNRFALVCLHHHPTAIGSPWMDCMGLDNGDQLLKLAREYPQVRAILWGHVHQEYDDSRQGVRLLGSPSTCMQFAPLAEQFALDDKPPGYRWIDLHADGTLATGIEWVTPEKGEALYES